MTAELHMQTVGRAGVMELMVAFLNFAKAPNESQSVHTQALIKMRTEVGVTMVKHSAT